MKHDVDSTHTYLSNPFGFSVGGAGLAIEELAPDRCCLFKWMCINSVKFDIGLDCGMSGLGGNVLEKRRPPVDGGVAEPAPVPKVCDNEEETPGRETPEGNRGIE